MTQLHTNQEHFETHMNLYAGPTNFAFGSPAKGFNVALCEMADEVLCGRCILFCCNARDELGVLQ